MHAIAHVILYFKPIWLALFAGVAIGFWVANIRFDNRHHQHFVDSFNRGIHLGTDLEASLWEINGRHDKGYHGLWDRLYAEMQRRKHGRVLQTMDDYKKELTHGE